MHIFFVHKKALIACLTILSLLALMPSTGAASAPAPNTFLSSPLYGITHFDSSQSDSTPYGPPRGTFYIESSL